MEMISTGKAPKAIGPYSQAVRDGGYLFLSGQIALDPSTGQLTGAGIEEQARRVLENMRGIIEAAGGRLTDVVKTTVFLTDMGDFQKFNEVYAGFFGDHRPARSVVGASALPRGARIELDAICRCGR
ncbi:RidA family protein [bacterium]|nr:RidA family protein [bacterium]